MKPVTLYFLSQGQNVFYKSTVSPCFGAVLVRMENSIQCLTMLPQSSSATMISYKANRILTTCEFYAQKRQERFPK